MAELTEQGVRVIDRSDLVHSGGRLDNLGIEPAAHGECPGHAAFVTLGWAAPHRVDGNAEVAGERTWQAVYVCTDAIANGHRDEPTGHGVAQRVPMSEEQKAERRQVIDANKDWRAATEVRREWLATFARRTTAPKGVEQFVLTCLLSGDHTIRQTMETRHSLLRTLLGVPVAEGPAWESGITEIDGVVQVLTTVSPKRQLLVVAALLLAAWEDKTSIQTWRNATADTRRYLGAMIEWGYDAGPLERSLVEG